VFVDRDGVLNALAPDPTTGLPESPLDLDALRLLPGVGAALRQLRLAGYLLVCVTNQPAAAKGAATVASLEAVHARVLQLLRDEGIEFDSSEMCLHHPNGVVPELAVVCACRKPEPGMLLHAAALLGIDLGRSWIVGDSTSDVEAGERAGCRTVLIEHLPSAHRRTGERPAGDGGALADDLPAAVNVIISAKGHC
jgi:D-glycero-D-manno-heptose 1,7-bisphosphate phosphatase